MSARTKLTSKVMMARRKPPHYERGGFKFYPGVKLDSSQIDDQRGVGSLDPYANSPRLKRSTNIDRRV